jgi:4-amino-4-deoxy-L-arabinose transferase-like glycosyltransferase
MNSGELPPPSVILTKKWQLWIVLILLMGLGLFLRLYDLTDLPLDFHPTRQLHSALMARGMYYQSLPETQDGRREMAIRQWHAEGVIEPPILEYITSQAYRILGSDQLWFPRLLSGLFWLFGAVALFLLARDIIGVEGGIVSLAFFLFLPFAVFASRSFQPDPLMTALMIWTLWAINRWRKYPTPSNVLLAGALGGLAILIKPIAVFFIAGAWLGVILAVPGLLRTLSQRSLWAAMLITILPYAIYHVYGFYVNGFLREQYSLRFFPNLWLDPLFYLRWVRKLDSSVGLAWFLLAGLSIFGVQGKAQRGLLFGAFIGYLVYCFSFAYHITTHDYYQLPLVPLVAIGLGAGAQLLLAGIKGKTGWIALAASAALLGGILITSYDVRSTLKDTDYRGEAAAMAALGDELRGHSIVGLFPDYGTRLEYWGWLTPTTWFATGDFEYRALAGQNINPVELFAEKTAGKDFFVVADLEAYANQPELKEFLTKTYPVWKQTSDLIIYDLR